jgi:flagellar hook-associated protein 3 FlgL
MRITANQIIKNMVYVINDRFFDMSRLQEQLSTGKRLLRPSDAPVDVANDLKLKTKLAEIKQFNRHRDDEHDRASAAHAGAGYRRINGHDVGQ